MKLYISIDMEGLWGIQSASQITPNGANYERGRLLMTKELNIVCENLFALGAKEIVANDSHGSMDNLLIENIDPRVTLISGQPKPLSMMEGIDHTFDGALFIGYHPRALSEKGIFDHTYSGRLIRSVTINQEPVGEAGLNARMAGYFNVPVIFVSGDNRLYEQLQAELPETQFLAVKQTISRYCAKHRSYNSLIKGYKEVLTQAMNEIKTFQPIKMNKPIIGEIDFKEAVMAEQAEMIPGVMKKNETMVSFQCDDYLTFYLRFQALLNICRT